MKSQPPLIRFNLLARCFALTLAASALLAGPASAASSSARQISPAAAEVMTSLKGLQERRDFTGMVAALDRGLASVKPESFDAVFLLEVKAKALMQLNRYDDARVAFERVLALSRQHGYFDASHEAMTEGYIRRLRERTAPKS